MKIASIIQIRKEIGQLPEAELVVLLSELAKYNKENKELLNYLLFEADFESNYIQKIKEDLDLQFQEINKSNIRFIKKGLQKIARELKKNIKYSGKKETEIELLIHFCKNMIALKIRLDRFPVLFNLLNRQFTNIEKAILKIDEDLHADYREEIELIENYLSSFTAYY
jgi:hypothetical protein